MHYIWFDKSYDDLILYDNMHIKTKLMQHNLGKCLCSTVDLYSSWIFIQCNISAPYVNGEYLLFTATEW